MKDKMEEDWQLGGVKAVKMANKNTGGGADFFQRKRGKQDNTSMLHLMEGQRVGQCSSLFPFFSR